MITKSQELSPVRAGQSLFAEAVLYVRYDSFTVYVCVQREGICLVGKMIGEKYILLEKIGRGGGGSVYKARDVRLGKQWAVKLLGTGKAGEAAVLKSLDHPMIPRVVDYLEEEGNLWLVMDYIPGKNLRELHRTGGISRRLLLEWALDLCQVLSYLHSLTPPCVHGDLKPENLVVSQDEKLFLVDFGAGAGRRGGICEGTPGFAPPEQEMGVVTCQCDIYAFGRTWELLLGRSAGSDWKKVIEKCCRQSPKKRYQEMGEVERRLRKMKRRRERGRFFVLLAGALAVCAAAGYSAGLGESVDGMWGDRQASGAFERQEEREAQKGAQSEEMRWRELGNLAEELGQAAEIRKEPDRQNGLHAAAENLKLFYEEERQKGRKLRAGLILARGYREDNCMDLAEKIYQELLLLYPDSAECYGSYGCMLWAMGAGKKRLRALYQQGERAVSDKNEYNYRIWAERMKEMGD